MEPGRAWGRLVVTYEQVLAQGLKPRVKRQPFIAAVNRYATQNPEVALAPKMETVLL